METLVARCYKLMFLMSPSLTQLQLLIHLLFERLSSLLESLLVVDQRGKSLESQRNNFDDFVLSVRKLRKLAGIICYFNLLLLGIVDYLFLGDLICTMYPISLELLDMPLKSITVAWESGELADCSFTVPEV